MQERTQRIAGTGAILLALSYPATATATADPDDEWRTVAEAIAESGTPTPWLARLHAAGLDHLPLTEVNRVAFEICDLIWVGGDYDKIIDHLTWDFSRKDAIQLYGVSVGHHCNTPPDAVPGFPK